MIYLDHNATTPVAPEVREAMLPFLSEEWGNPSSNYRFGSKLKSVIESAREQVGALLGSSPGEILFTSCATESNNTAIHAALKANPQKRHVITSAVEHSSVLMYCGALEQEGVRVTYLPVDRDGLLQPLDARLGWEPFRHRPTLEHSLPLQPEIEVMRAGVVLLNDEVRPAPTPSLGIIHHRNSK